MSEQEWEDKLAEVQKHSEHWYNKYKELENKIADIKANCDFVLEGKDVEIKELKDHLAEEVELHLHAEEYIKSLEKENKTLEGCLLAEQEHTQMLEKQIEKMKCCGNCRFSESDTLNGTFCHREGCFVVASANCKRWEM